MRTRLLVVLCAAFLSALSNAQEDGARFQVFGGYSYTGYAIYDTYSGPWRSFGYSGWEASGAAKLLPHVAAEADFAGGFASPYGRSSSLRTYIWEDLAFRPISQKQQFLAMSCSAGSV